MKHYIAYLLIGLGGLAATAAFTEQQSGPATVVVATEAIGKAVVDSEGQEVGQVEKVVASSYGGEPMALVETDGPHGIGKRRLHLPLRQLTLNDDGELEASLTHAELIAHHAIAEDELEDAE